MLASLGPCQEDDNVPTYRYVCTDCGNQLEVVQKFTDDALTACPTCEGRLRKVFSAVGVVFKGSGFYRTDSRAPANASGGNGKGSANGSDSSSDSESTGSDSGAKKEPAATSARTPSSTSGSSTG